MSKKSVSDPEIQRIKQGLNDLGEAIFQLANAETEPPVLEINDRSISGNKIHGGKITKFESVGIKDDSTRLVVLVNNDGIITDNIDVETLVGDTTVTGKLTVEGHITAQSLHVDELTADIRQERSSPLEFIANEGDKIYGKGLLFRDEQKTRQITLQSGPDRFFFSDPIDLYRDAYISVNGVSVLSEKELGTTITKSNLRQVGTLENLSTQGDLTIDDFVFWKSDYMRLGVGTDAPNGIISLAQDSAELILDVNNRTAKIGTFTTSDFDIVSDNVTRISVGATGKIVIGSDTDTKVTVKGRLGVNVNNPDTDIATAGPVSFEGKRFEVGESEPKTGFYKVGDIVWNAQPRPTGFVGWICVKEGTPGVWKTFGPISS